MRPRRQKAVVRSRSDLDVRDVTFICKDTPALNSGVPIAARGNLSYQVLRLNLCGFFSPEESSVLLGRADFRHNGCQYCLGNPPFTRQQDFRVGYLLTSWQTRILQSQPDMASSICLDEWFIDKCFQLARGQLLSHGSGCLWKLFIDLRVGTAGLISVLAGRIPVRNSWLFFGIAFLIRLLQRHFFVELYRSTYTLIFFEHRQDQNSLTIRMSKSSFIAQGYLLAPLVFFTSKSTPSVRSR